MEIDYKKLVDALLERNAFTGKGVVSSTPTTTYGHGPAGLFSYPGLSRPVFSAMSLPHIGLQSRLPVQESRDANPIYSIFTGVTATSGSEPTGVCDDFPTAGLSKLCTQTQVFGRMGRQSRVFELDRMGLWTNRGEFGDLQFMGQPFQARNPNTPSIGTDLNAMLAREVNKALFELAVAWSRDFARDIYTANPTNNTAGGGRKYWYGLDILINTGHRDVISGQACAAADSIVRSFGSLPIDANAAAFIRQVTNIYRNLKYVAASTGLDPVKWALVMPWSMFYEITEVWPCAYLSYRCTNLASGSTQFIDSGAQIAMRDSMRGDIYSRTGQYLLIDGEQVEVILDDAVTESVLAGESFTAPIYFVPLTVLGGTPVLFTEYLNYDMPGGAMDAARAMAPDGFYYTSDNGRFLWHKKLPNNYCVQLMAKTEPRIMLLTPQLAARLTNIKYTPVAHERSWDTASSYYVDGGKTDFGGFGPSLYSPVTP